MKELISCYLSSDQEVKDAPCDNFDCEGRVKEVYLKGADVLKDLLTMDGDDGCIWIVGGKPWRYGNGLFVKSRCSICGCQIRAFRSDPDSGMDLNFQIEPHFVAKI